ncbi:hypothetical protein BOTBODRAFT_35986 [Botryobasidium botryosum FD-172 SS1]|uniref:CSC1/OSCA1-like 7TM region domain-containing protein n=1 Tax=Botryobasidium botryosum (strain FD-172 SS1) TaxID=930990 RepID=A0A067M7I6_BOTB1|nr:hypothetical protein BOTBODRAFT_35986 [Botryobasidium botryosum FD-172 SS1]
MGADLAAWMHPILEYLLDGPPVPPGTPPSKKYDGPWFQTQLLISTALGLSCFLLFSYARTRWPVLFASRTKLSGFSPHDGHINQSFFSWILPTIRTSEFTVLQIVGLDASVLLNFLKMSFYLFSVLSMMVVSILMPINYYNNGKMVDDDNDDDDWPDSSAFNATYSFHTDAPPPKSGSKFGDWIDLINDANSILFLHLVFAYAFTIITLRFLYTNYKRFVRSRQLFSLELVHSIAARTVMVTNLPSHLRGERALAEYFENMNLPVESVSLCREVTSLKDLIERRTEALLQLENAWVDYVGNPSSVSSYDPSLNVRTDDGTSGYLVDISNGGRLEAQHPPRLVVPNRPRPTLRAGGWWGRKIDALEHFEAKFKAADEAVRKKRKTGKFKSTQSAFVTFETMSSAEIATQIVHSPYNAQCVTAHAPEPRDIVWSNMGHSPSMLRVRELLVGAFMVLLFFFWLIPISGLATLLSYKEIKKAAPWLGRLIDHSPKIQALVQTSLPSVAVIGLNGLLPFMLEALSYFQGHQARSWVEYSLLKKYFLFLLVNVVGIFLLASTYWALVRDLANSPAKIPEKLAMALKRGSAKHFFLSYVVFQGLGVMPLQLLNLGVLVPRMFYRMFITRTPRDFAELNAPPMVNYGAVYPQAILVFVITLIYSIIQPLILIFGAVYFGVAYVVYKYKLLFVFYKPYESRGQAWPITFVRLIWGVVIFQLFMTGIFTLEKSWIFTTTMLPLIAFTVYWGWSMNKSFAGLGQHTSLSSVFEVQRGEATGEVARLRAGYPVPWSQSVLNRRRYAENDETLYVAPEDDRTDYSQPPMANWYYGILNTGKRRYGHPALTGVLPQPWLPIKKGQTLANHIDRGEGGGWGGDDQAVVLTLRRRTNSSPRKSRNRSVDALSRGNGGGDGEQAAALGNPWSDTRSERTGSGSLQFPSFPHSNQLSFDPATGVIMLPEHGNWMGDLDTDSSEEESSLARSGEEGHEVVGAQSAGGSVNGTPGAGPSGSGGGGGSTPEPSGRRATYYHHPERKKRMPGSFTGTR